MKMIRQGLNQKHHSCVCTSTYASKQVRSCVLQAAVAAGMDLVYISTLLTWLFLHFCTAIRQDKTVRTLIEIKLFILSLYIKSLWKKGGKSTQRTLLGGHLKCTGCLACFPVLINDYFTSFILDLSDLADASSAKFSYPD